MSIYKRHGLERSRKLLTLLFVMGIAHWLFFFYLVFPEGGDGRLLGMAVSGAPVFAVETFDAHGWYKERNYVDVVRQSLNEKILPFHVAGLGQVAYRTAFSACPYGR